MDLIRSNNSTEVFKLCERDILAELLRDTRSLSTKRAIQNDIKDFFSSFTSHPVNPRLLQEFLTLDRFTAIGLVIEYKAKLMERGLAEATVNRRLSSIKALVRRASAVGKCEWSLEEIKSEKIQKYRDTSGCSVEEFNLVLSTCDTTTLLGIRNYAILTLLWTNVLRRGEINKLNILDYDGQKRKLQVLGKGKGLQKVGVTLPEKTCCAINAWLEVYPVAYTPASPLFIAANKNHLGSRLSGDSIFDVVSRASLQAGIKKLSPHRIRHSGITAALDATGGDVRSVQKLSRHKNIETLMIYDDNRRDLQSDVSDALALLAIVDKKNPV